MRSSRARSLLVTAVLTAICVLGWYYFAPTQIGGSTSYVVTHGISMEPLLHTGDLVLVRPVDDYRVGDVVAYHSTLLHTVVLHRIRQIVDGRYTFKGDNNDFLDPTHPTRALLIGRMWLHISNGGAVLLWLHRPFVAAAVLGSVAILLLFGSDRKRRRRDRGRRQVGGAGGPKRARPMTTLTPHSGPRIGSRQLLAASLAGMILFAALTILAFTRATTNHTTVSRPYSQQLKFGYHAHVAPGPVYPSGTISTGEPVYLQLVHRLTVTATYRLKIAAPAQLHGTIRIRGTLTNTSGWSRGFWLGHAIRFSGDRGRTSAALNLTRLTSLADRISTQIGDGAGSYSLAVTPRVKLAGVAGGAPFSVADDQSLELELGTPQLLTGTSAISSSASTTGTATGGSSQQGLVRTTTGAVASVRSATGTLAGIPVSVVRWVALLLLALCAALALHLGRRELGSDTDPVERINSRYRHLIVPVGAITPSPEHPPIEVSTIDGLAQLAERSERLILHDHQSDADDYLVDDQGTLFRYRAPRSGAARVNGMDHADTGGSGSGEGDHPGKRGNTVRAKTRGSGSAKSGVRAHLAALSASRGRARAANDDVPTPADPAAETAAAILSAAAAKLSAAATRAASEPSSTAEPVVTAEPVAATKPLAAAEHPATAEHPAGAEPVTTGEPSADAQETAATAENYGPVATPAADPADIAATAAIEEDTEARPLTHDDAQPPSDPMDRVAASHLTERSTPDLQVVGATPRQSQVPVSRHWHSRPEVRVGFAIGPLALALFAWLHLRTRSHPEPVDEPADDPPRTLWTTRYLASRPSRR